MAPQSLLTIFNLLSFIGAFLVLIGGVGIWYYGDKVDDLKDRKILELVAGKNSLLEESNKVKQQNSLMLHALENSGNFRFKRDGEGQVTGIIIELTGVAAATSTAVGELTDASKQ